MESEEQRPSAEVLVVGAGIAGLSAARALAEAGKSVLLLEAGNRIGGRIRSQTVPGLTEPVELGAEFVHGLPQDLHLLLKQAGLETYELTGPSYSSDGGLLTAEEEDSVDTALLDRLGDRVSDPSGTDAGADLSFSAYMDQQQVSPSARQHLAGYVEGFNAADIHRISTQALAFQQAAENAIDGDRVFHVRRGYSALADYVFARYEEAGGKTRFQHRVDSIEWSKQGASLTVTIAGETVRLAGRCIVLAVPLGVLQSRRIAVTPWPDELNAIDQMAMGPVHRISLVFKERFWSRPPYNAGDLSFLFAQQATPSVWWTPHPSKTPVLTGWIGGTRVRDTAAADLLDTALESLVKIFSIARPDLEALFVSSHTHDWNRDPLSLGAYSYVITGGIHASSTLSTPIDGTIFVAGEHTDVSGHWGTVHGALRSGMRAARQVLEAFGV